MSNPLLLTSALQPPPEEVGEPHSTLVASDGANAKGAVPNFR